MEAEEIVAAECGMKTEADESPRIGSLSDEALFRAALQRMRLRDFTHPDWKERTKLVLLDRDGDQVAGFLFKNGIFLWMESYGEDGDEVCTAGEL